MIQQKKIALFIVVLFLTACSKQLILKQTNISQINVAAKVQPDQAILDFYEPYKKSLDSQMNRVVGTSAI